MFVHRFFDFGIIKVSFKVAFKCGIQKVSTVILQPWQCNMTTLNILGLVIMPSLDDGMMERYITGMKA